MEKLTIGGAGGGDSRVWKRNQGDVGNSSFTAMCSYDNWRMVRYAYINLLYVNTSAELMCDICGPGQRLSFVTRLL